MSSPQSSILSKTNSLIYSKKEAQKRRNSMKEIFDEYRTSLSSNEKRNSKSFDEKTGRRSSSLNGVKNCKCPKLTPGERIVALEHALNEAYGGLRTKDLLIRLQKTKLTTLEEVNETNEKRNENLTYINQRLVDDLDYLKNIIKQYEGKYGKITDEEYEFYKPDIPTSLDTVKGLLINQNAKLENILNVLKNSNNCNINSIANELNRYSEKSRNSTDPSENEMLAMANEALILEIEDLRLQLQTLRATAFTSRELVDEITSKSEAYVNALVNSENEGHHKLLFSATPQIHDFEVEDDVGSLERFMEESSQKLNTIATRFQSIQEIPEQAEVSTIIVKKDSLVKYRKESGESKDSLYDTHVSKSETDVRFADHIINIDDEIKDKLAENVQNIEKSPTKVNAFKLTIDREDPRPSVINKNASQSKDVEKVKAKLLADIENMKKVSDKLSASIEEERKGWAKKVEEYEKIKSKGEEYRKQKEDNEMINDKLNKENEELNKRIDFLINQYQSAEAQNKEYIEEADDIIDNLKRQLQSSKMESEQEIRNLNTLLTEKGNKLQELEIELAKCKEELSEKEAQINVLLIYPEKLKEAENRAESLDEKCCELLEKNEMLDTDREVMEVLRESLQTKLEDALCDMDAHKTTINTLTNLNENLTLKVQELEEKIVNLISVNEAITQDYDEGVREIENMKQSAMCDMNKLREEIDVLRDSHKEAYNKFVEANEMLETTLAEKENIALEKFQLSQQGISKNDLMHIIKECGDYKMKLDKISLKIDKHVKEHTLYKYEAEQRIKKLLLENKVLHQKYEKEACPLLISRCCRDDVNLQIGELRQYIVAAGRHIQQVDIAKSRAEEILEKLKCTKNSVCQFICNYDTVNASTSLGGKTMPILPDANRSQISHVSTNERLFKQVQEIREKKNAALVKKVNQEANEIKKEIKREISNNINMKIVSECCCEGIKRRNH